jgi:cytochrome P450
MRIVASSLLSIDIDSDPEAASFSKSIIQAQLELAAYLRFPVIPLSFPTPGHLRFHKHNQVLTNYTMRIIQERRSQPADRGDMLSMLLEAQLENGDFFTDKQLRDELITFLFAGHETSANGLTWAFYHLTQHPEVEAKMVEELDRVLQGRRPTMEDLPKLSYIAQVVNETLRLNSPSWQIMRHAVEYDQMGEYLIEKGSNILWSPFLIHRHPEFWPNPETFDPDRFLPERIAQQHKGAYIPFSSGPRLCIGNMFALTEMQMTLAIIYQHYRPVLMQQKPITPVASLTLTPSEPILVRLQARS